MTRTTLTKEEEKIIRSRLMVDILTGKRKGLHCGKSWKHDPAKWIVVIAPQNNPRYPVSKCVYMLYCNECKETKKLLSSDLKRIRFVKI